MSVETVRIAEIRRDGGTQPRARMNEDAVVEYVEALHDDAEFPPVTVYYDGRHYWLADGFHRVEAHERAGVDEIRADVRQGERDDAVVHSWGANADHGLRRTNADKRRAVEAALRHPRWGRESDRAIARMCRVTHPFVAKVRKELSGNDYQMPDERLVRRGDQVYTQRTENIGRQSGPETARHGKAFVNPVTGQPFAVDTGGDERGVERDVVTDTEPATWPAEDLATLPAEEQRRLAEQLDPKVVARLAKERREERKAEQRRRRDEKAAAQAAVATAAAPHVEGIDLRRADVYDVFALAEGFALGHADPSWQYDNQGNGGVDEHYDGLPLEQIVSDLDNAFDRAADDAILLCWITQPYLIPFGIEIGRRLQADIELGVARPSWRWKYQSSAVWTKEGPLGIGHYWRGHAETLMLFTKGSPAVLGTIRNEHRSDPTEHSEKPVEWLRELVRTFCPAGGLVFDMYAGLAPVARACAVEGRRYLGAEINEERHAKALRKLAAYLAEHGGAA